jgi:hypothetical protein
MRYWPEGAATASVLYAHVLGLVPITTPAYSPQSNRLAAAFGKMFKRDYLAAADLRDAETVRAQLAGRSQHPDPASCARDAEPGGVRSEPHVQSLRRAVKRGALQFLARRIQEGKISPWRPQAPASWSSSLGEHSPAIRCLAGARRGPWDVVQTKSGRPRLIATLPNTCSTRSSSYVSMTMMG